MGKILRTDELMKSQYFAGFAEGSMGLCVVLSSNIFDAMTIEDADLQEIKDTFSEFHFVESEILSMGISDNLK